MPASQAGRRGFESHRPLFSVFALHQRLRPTPIWGGPSVCLGHIVGHSGFSSSTTTRGRAPDCVRSLRRNPTAPCLARRRMAVRRAPLSVRWKRTSSSSIGRCLTCRDSRGCSMSGPRPCLSSSSVRRTSSTRSRRSRRMRWTIGWNRLMRRACTRPRRGPAVRHRARRRHHTDRSRRQLRGLAHGEGAARGDEEPPPPGRGRARSRDARARASADDREYCTRRHCHTRRTRGSRVASRRRPYCPLQPALPRPPRRASSLPQLGTQQRKRRPVRRQTGAPIPPGLPLVLRDLPLVRRPMTRARRLTEPLEEPAAREVCDAAVTLVPRL